MRIRRFAALLLIPAALALWGQQHDSIGQEPEPPTTAVQERSPEPLPLGSLLALADEQKDDRKPTNRPLSEFMQKKLDASSEILRGLMVDDLELVENNAEQLLKMSHEEKWRASNDMMYLQHSTQFRHAVDDLRAKASRMSTDGASLAWVNVTMSCIQCHQWVRNMVLADLDEPNQ